MADGARATGTRSTEVGAFGLPVSHWRHDLEPVGVSDRRSHAAASVDATRREVEAAAEGEHVAVS